MQKKIRIDYHCHPNLPLFLPVINLFLARIKARALWRVFARHNLDVVFLRREK